MKFSKRYQDIIENILILKTVAITAKRQKHQNLHASNSTLGYKKRTFNFKRGYGFHFVVVVVVTQPLPRDGGVAGDHRVPEAGKLSRVWTRGCTETESRQRATSPESPQLDSAD